MTIRVEIDNVTMAYSKLTIAQGLAILASIAVLINTLNTVVGLFFLPFDTQTAGIMFGLTGILLSIGAFAISWGQKSVLISGLLLVTGILITLGGIAGTGYFAVIVFPGPIIGVFLGLAVIGMGIVKSVRTGMAIKATATR
ncbi:MAG: hypothetical protein M3114_05760 [Thermoproteota archaeon]|nr:hypothetical protein [Thermoproteota archaeon]